MLYSFSGRLTVSRLPSSRDMRPLESRSANLMSDRRMAVYGGHQGTTEGVAFDWMIATKLGK